MSSFNIRNIREISNDPLTKFTNSLAKKLAKFLNDQQQEKLESKEDIYSVSEDVESIIRFHSLVSTKTFSLSTIYYPTFEPDLDKNTLWIKGRNMGSTTKDFSGFKNTITMTGDPLLIDGTPFNYGNHTSGTKSVALKFNRPTSSTENTEEIKVSDNTRLKVNGITTGISYFIRFRIHSLADQGGISRTLFEKVDDSTPNDAAMIQVRSDGRLVFIVKRAVTTYAQQAAAGTIATNTVYEVWCTYANSGNTIHIYVNNVDKSLASFPDAVNWQSDRSVRNLHIFRRGLGSNGYVYGDLYDFMVYREKVVSTTEVGYHYTNKWTIYNIPFGQVMVTDYYSTYNIVEDSFTSASFTGTSFTI